MRITPFLISYPIGIILFLNHICSNVWTSFSMIFIIGFTILTTLVFFIERLIVKNLNIKFVWGIELIIIILLLWVFY